MIHQLFKNSDERFQHKRFINLIIIIIFYICLLFMLSFNCLTIHNKHYSQSALIENTTINTINYFDLKKEAESTNQKNNIYKEKSKKSKLYEAYATYYHRGGKKTANGESFQPYSKLTCAASHIFPFGTKLKVTNIANEKSIIVTVTDRGSFYKKRGHEYDLDLTYLTFSKIAKHSTGRIKIKYEIIN